MQKYLFIYILYYTATELFLTVYALCNFLLFECATRFQGQKRRNFVKTADEISLDKLPSVIYNIIQ